MRDCTTFLSHSIAFLHLVIQHFYNLSYGVFFFFLESWQNWLVWIWMRAEVGVSQSLVSRMALSECDERVLFLDFRGWNASSRKALVESLIRNLHCTRGDFFFLSLRFRRRRKKKWYKIDIDTLWCTGSIRWCLTSVHVPFTRKWSPSIFPTFPLPWSDKLTGDGDK